MNAMQASIAGDPEALQELVDKRIKALVGEGES